MSTDAKPSSLFARTTRNIGNLVQTSGVAVPLVLLWIVLALTTRETHCRQLVDE